jgi:hypothetical protein
VLAARDHLEGAPRQARVGGHEVDRGRRRDAWRVAIGTSIGVVVIAIGPERDVKALGLRGPGEAAGLGQRERERRRKDRGAADPAPRYSRQPHWIHRNSVSVSSVCPLGLPFEAARMSAAHAVFARMRDGRSSSASSRARSRVF